jgi:hypothetical protein
MRPISELSLFITFFLGLSNILGLKIPFEVYPRGPGPTTDFTSTTRVTYAVGATSADTLDNKMDIRVRTDVT